MSGRPTAGSVGTGLPLLAKRANALPSLARRATWLLAAALLGLALLATGCTKPPPALPKAVMAQGEEAIPEKHPKLTEKQVEQCTVCHREVPDPPQ